MLSQEIFYVILAELFILVPSTAHIALSSRITHPIRLPFCVISGFFMIINSYFLLSTTLRDPGRLAKNFTTEDQPSTVEVNGQVFNTKVCPTCKIVKSLRTHHCKVCDCCVDRLDHHCPWVGNCVGRRNHRSFMLLLIFTTLHAGFMLAANIAEASILTPPPGGYGGEAILIIFSVVLGWSIASILGYQVFLVVKGKTTHEHRRKTFDKNPFDQGPWRNCLTFWTMKDKPIKTLNPQNQV